MSSVAGGVENLNLNYFKEAEKSGVIFDYVNCYDFIAYEEDFLNAGAIIHKIPDPKKNPVEYRKKLTEICRGYDVVSVHMLSAANPLPLICAKDAGVPVIIAHVHSTSTEGLLKNILHRMNKKKICSLANCYFACSNRAASWLFTDDLISDGKVIFINNAVNTSRFSFYAPARSEVRRDYNISNDAKVLCHVGRHTKEKNISFLLKVMKKLKNDNIYLILVGDGILTEKLKKQAERYGISNKVRFTGRCLTPERIYSTADIFVLPSLYEGLSISAVEAQASGLKCLLSDRVTEETVLTDNAFQLPLSVNIWVKAIRETEIPTHAERDLTNIAIRHAGYNISDCSKKYLLTINNEYKKHKES